MPEVLTETEPEVVQMICECDGGGLCGQFIPRDTWRALDDWRCEDERDAGDDLFIVRSEHANAREIVQRYGNYCVVRDAALSVDFESQNKE